MANPFHDEIVDDSEPEREEMRQRKRDARKMTSPSRAGTMKRSFKTLEIIEITDDESDVRLLSSDINIPDSNLTLDDREHASRTSSSGMIQPRSSPLYIRSNVELSGIQRTHVSNPSSLTREHQLVPTTMQPKSSRSFDVAPPIDVLDDPETSADDVGVEIDLTHFTYSGPAPSRAPAPRPFYKTSGLPVDAEPKPLPKKRLARGNVHQHLAQFSDADLANLLKCVSCDIRWTARKTAAQKMMHIKSCAKKNVFTDETIRTLIQKEIDKFTAGVLQTAENEKGKAKAISGSPRELAPKTFFEDIVTGAAPKRKARRLEAVETVKGVTITRDFILEKARAVLGHNDNRILAQTQASGNSKLGSEDTMLPSTQSFGQSALGQMHPKGACATSMSPVKHGLSDDNRDFEMMLPATQNFGSSKLGSATHFPSLLVRSQELGNPTSPNPRSTAKVSPAVMNEPKVHDAGSPFANKPVPYVRHSYSILDYKAIGARKQSLHQQSEGKSKEALPPSPHFLRSSPPAPDLSLGHEDSRLCLDGTQEQIDESGWNNDDQVLHFDPEFNSLRETKENDIVSFTPPKATRPHVLMNMPVVKSPKIKKLPKTKKARRTYELDISSDIISKANKTNTKQKGSRKTMAEPEQGSDEIWEKWMKDRIVQDNDLHLRILRYEPIHFEVFLDVAMDGYSYSGKLKERLRSFLDKQAVNFYGAETTTRRR